MAMEPHITPLDHPLEPGNQIVVRGTLVGDKFDINLSAGPDMVYRKSTGDDIALHITYSRGSRTIILNSFERGAWQQEENYNASFIREQALFEVRVAVQPDRFEIFVDNIKLADFRHRLPPQAVRFVYIVGDLSLQMVDVGNRSDRQTRSTKAHALEQLDPSVLTPGNAIVVRGVPTGAKFDINLSYGPDMVHEKPTGDNVALHVSYSGGSRRILLNSFENGHWGQEEQYDAQAIQQGVPFEIRILVDQGRFGIFLNGQQLASFNNRLPLDRVQYIYIVGDINLEQLDLGGRSGRQTRDTQQKVHALEKLDPSALTPGNTIIVRGTPDGAKFDINLSSGPDMVYLKPTGDNIALHVSYSGGSRRIILNSFENGHWGGEEQHDAPSIQQGVPFEIRIAVDQGRFGITVDGQKLADFNFRQPLNQIHYIYIVGDIKFQSLNTGVAGAQPQPQPQHDAPAQPLSYPSVLPVPYRLKFPHNFAPGQKLVIIGTPNSDAAKFHINLYAGHLNAFHNLVNFQEKTVYRDSRSKGEDWDKKGETDSKSGFPYAPGKQFQLVYAPEENAFQVYVDGVHHFSYNHRLPLNKINALGIEGNLKLHSVKLE